ncbi:MAG: hypothetical protein H7X80_03910 [bacterium]|nr:hypothetical protein [Candidatus Kapabacteria bacterium]
MTIELAQSIELVNETQSGSMAQAVDPLFGFRFWIFDLGKSRPLGARSTHPNGQSLSEFLNRKSIFESQHVSQIENPKSKTENRHISQIEDPKSKTENRHISQIENPKSKIENPALFAPTHLPIHYPPHPTDAAHSTPALPCLQLTTVEQRNGNGTHRPL